MSWPRVRRPHYPAPATQQRRAARARVGVSFWDKPLPGYEWACCLLKRRACGVFTRARTTPAYCSNVFAPAVQAPQTMAVRPLVLIALLSAVLAPVCCVDGRELQGKSRWWCVPPSMLAPRWPAFFLPQRCPVAQLPAHYPRQVASPCSLCALLLLP